MKRIRKCFCFFLLCFLFISCGRQAKSENEQLMQQAGLLVEQKPDSALLLLDSVRIVLLSSEQKADYVLLKVYARDIAGLNLSFDNEIFEARDYFINKNNKENAAWACLYAGKVLQAQEKRNEATKEFQQASEWAKKANNHALMGLAQYGIGVVNFKQFAFDEAIPYFKKAGQDFEDKNEEYWNKQKIKTLVLIATSFAYLSAPDSALYYYNEAFNVAERDMDTLFQRDILLNTAVVLCETGKFDTAKIICRRSIAMTAHNDSIELAKLYLNLADIYNNTRQKDSAMIFITKAHNLLINSTDSKNVAYLYETLSSMEQANENYKKALQYYQQYTIHLEAIYQEIADKEVLDIQKKYRFDLVQEELQIQRKQKIYITLIVLLMAIAVGLFTNWKRMKAENTALETEEKYRTHLDMYNKLKGTVAESETENSLHEETERELLNQLEQLQVQVAELEAVKLTLSNLLEQLQIQISSSDAEKASHNEKKEALVVQLEKLQKQLAEANRKEQKLISRRKQLTEQVDSLKQAYDANEKELIAQLQQAFDMIADMTQLGELKTNSMITQRKVEKILDRIKPESFIAFINKRQPRLAINLKKEYPQLTGQEFNICCLRHWGFNAKVIALILGLQPTTVRQRCSDLRKTFHIEERGSIEDFLTSLIS